MVENFSGSQARLGVILKQLCAYNSIRIRNLNNYDSRKETPGLRNMSTYDQNVLMEKLEMLLIQRNTACHQNAGLLYRLWPCFSLNMISIARMLLKFRKVPGVMNLKSTFETMTGILEPNMELEITSAKSIWANLKSNKL